MTFDYTQCEKLSAQSPNSDINSLTFSSLPTYNYRLSAAHSKASITPPQYAFINNSASTDPSQKLQCIIKFNVPADLSHSVFLYYKLTNFYQNHRRYVKSLDSDQLRGKFVSTGDLNNGDCKPLAVIDNKAVYPCGLIANSWFNGKCRGELQRAKRTVYLGYRELKAQSEQCILWLRCILCLAALVLSSSLYAQRLNAYLFLSFSDSYSALTALNPASGSPSTYNFSETGIAWPGEAKKYTSKPDYDFSQIVPPPNWALMYPNNYSDSSPPPDLHANEHFQNWMRTAGLPTFSKLYGRNDADDLKSGQYSITVNLSSYSSFIVSGLD